MKDRRQYDKRHYKDAKSIDKICEKEVKSEIFSDRTKHAFMFIVIITNYLIACQN